MNQDAMLVEWCIGRATGDRAKSILDHAAAGLGYFIMESGRQGNQAFCLYAFRRATDSPVPDHLTVVVDPFMLKKLNDRHDARIGADRHQRPTVSADPKRIKEIKDLFNNRKVLKEPGKVPVKQNNDGSTEMPDDFLQ